jgi:hypothetical protein
MLGPEKPDRKYSQIQPAGKPAKKLAGFNNFRLFYRGISP